MMGCFSGAFAPADVARAFGKGKPGRGALLRSSALISVCLGATAPAAGQSYEYNATATYSAAVSLNSPTATQFVVDNGVTATVSGPITEGAPNQSVEFSANSGAGTIVLTNPSNAWTGATTIDAGATVALAGSNLGTSRVVDNGVLDVSRGVTVAGVDTINVVDYNYGNYNGATVAGASGAAGTLNWNTAGYFTTGTIAFTNSAGIITDVISTISGTDAYTFYNVLSGNPLIGTSCVASGTVACFVSNGSSQDVSSAIATFNGGTGIFNGGTINATIMDQYGQAASVLSLAGSGSVVLGSTPLTILSASDSFSGTISGTGGVTIAGGTETFTGTNSYTGATTIAPGAVLALAGAGSIASSSTVQADGTLDISQATGNANITSLGGAGAVTLGANTLVLTNAADTFSGVISGTGNLTLLSGNETLSGANIYTGTTTVAGGTLTVGTSNAVSPSSSLIVGSAGTLDLGTFNQTVTTAAIAGAVNGTGGATLTAQTYTLAGATINANLGTGTLDVAAGSSTLSGTAQASALNIDTGSLTLGAPSLLATNVAVTLSNNGTLDIGGNDQTIGSLAGQGTVQMNGAALTVAQAADTVFAGNIAGTGTFAKSGAGRLVLTGDSSFTGPTTVVGGTLEVDGGLASSSVSVGADAMLAGSGSVGSVTVAQGAVLSPGASGGTGALAVAGNLVFQSGSHFQVNATPTAASVVSAAGTVNIQGGAVDVLANGTAYKLATTYRVLTASGGVSGTFDSVDSNLAFLIPTLSYSANEVDLTLTRNDVDFSSVARTPNQHAVANILTLMATDSVIVQNIQSLSAVQARQAYDGLSGETYAALPSALIEESSRVRDTLLADGQRSGDGFGVFGNAMDDGGEFHTTSDTSKLATHRQGLIAGIDYGRDGFRAGAASGYSYGTYLMGANGSQAQVKSYYAGGQLSYQAGPIRAQIGGAYSWHDINTDRSVDFGAFTDSLQSKQKAHTIQGFGELGYALIQHDGFKLEPFVGYARIRAVVDGTGELSSTSPLAALDVDTVKRDVNDATVGFHLTGRTPIGSNGALFEPHLTLAFQHAWGDRAGSATVALPGFASFDIVGATLAGNSAKIDGGADVAFGRFSIGVSYVGAAGANQADHGVKASATMRF